MKRNRLLYAAGVAIGLVGVFLLIPEARTTASALVSQTAGRARKAWEEGKRAKERREHELEEEVLGSSEPGPEERNTPDYIV